MSEILETPYQFASHAAPNRLVAQAMESNGGEKGAVTPEVIQRYKRLAEGGWGMVFVEATSITEGQLARVRGLVITEKTLDGFGRLVESFREANGRSLLLFQLTHAGRLSRERPVKAYEDDAADIPVLTEEDLDEAVDNCIGAARLAHEAGADGVDIKACHGYLGGELLRPKNLRTDRYGGSAENRARYVAAVIGAVKESLPGFLVGSRVSLYEGIRGGCGTAGPDEVIEDLAADILEVVSVIAGAGADFINVSAGIPALTPTLTRPTVAGDVNLYHHFRYARAVKERLGRVAVIGSAYSTAGEAAAGFAEENVRRGFADFAGFGRQTLADPLLPTKLFSDPGTIRYCVRCGGCSRLLKEQRPVSCTKYRDKEDGAP
jgi:2,4-dienoyl-CoA reductase-like NADH-dependent reductase (Old Yellow Enzyme family)